MLTIDRDFWRLIEDELDHGDAVDLKRKFVRYEKAHGVPQEYQRLLEFKVVMYMRFYFRAQRTYGQRSFWPTSRDFTFVKGEIDNEIVRLRLLFVNAIIREHGAAPLYSFDQGVILNEANIKSNGVCNALALDWLRRKNWNTQGGKQKKMYDRSPEAKRALITKADALQSISTRPTKLRAMEERLRADGGGPKGFLLLKELKKVSVDVDGEEALGYALHGHLMNPQLLRYPRCIYLDFSRLTRGALAGHALAMFQAAAGSDFHFFDSNHGEYRIAPTRVAWFVANWYELYRPYGMEFKAVFFVDDDGD